MRHGLVVDLGARAMLITVRRWTETGRITISHATTDAGHIRAKAYLAARHSTQASAVA
jgi:hypothetical protein